MKRIHSITFSILFFASTIGVTFHINLSKDARHSSASKIGKNNQNKTMILPREKLA